MSLYVQFTQQPCTYLSNYRCEQCFAIETNNYFVNPTDIRIRL